MPTYNNKSFIFRLLFYFKTVHVNQVIKLQKTSTRDILKKTLEKDWKIAKVFKVLWNVAYFDSLHIMCFFLTPYY